MERSVGTERKRACIQMAATVSMCSTVRTADENPASRDASCQVSQLLARLVKAAGTYWAARRA
eukprot:7209288-Lingulodinium_polyedra.AAC.1